jgi:hypothetical protein
MPPQSIPSKVDQERALRRADYSEPATFKTGVDLVLCTLCKEHETRNPTSVCCWCIEDRKTVDRLVTDEELWHFGGARAVREGPYREPEE